MYIYICTYNLYVYERRGRSIRSSLVGIWDLLKTKSK